MKRCASPLRTPDLVLWREIVAKRSDQSSRLNEAAKQLDATKWPAPVVSLFLGTMTPEQVLDAADDADPGEEKRRRSARRISMLPSALLQSGSKEEALKLFEQAAADRPKTFIEKQAADVELSSLRASR